MLIKFEPNEDKESALERLRYHLELYFEGADDPLNCEPACRVSEIEENPNCNRCVDRYIDYLIETIKDREELTF